MYIKKLFILFCLVSCLIFAEPESSVFKVYQRVDEKMFKDFIVGNTVVGITRNSHSLYMLHFLSDGSCTMWKHNHVYAGKWWIEKDFIRAYWPEYISSQTGSLFNPENSNFGKATTVSYYYDPELKALLLVSKSYKSQALLVPGIAF